MFNKQNINVERSKSKRQVNHVVNRGLALLIVLCVSVIGASWLFSVPVYFDLKVAAQISPLIFTIILLFAVTRVQHLYINSIATPLSFVVGFSSWSYVVYLNVITQDKSVTDLYAAQLLGMSNSMYLLGLCLLTLWLGRYFKYAIYLASIMILALPALLFSFTEIQTSYLIALFLLLACTGLVSILGFNVDSYSIPASKSDLFNDALDYPVDEDMLLPSELEEEEITPELEINVIPLNETSPTHDWELILRELQGELQNTSDVDLLFKRMLVFLQGALEFDAAAVGMLQDKTLKKIATYGGDEYLHTQALNWTNQRIKELFASKEPKVSQQSHLSSNAIESTEPLHRLDIPVISNQKVLGVVTLFRETLVFDSNDVKLSSSIVFHSMLALRQARLQEEVKRLSSDNSTAKLTLYTREQFMSKVKPVLEKLGKPRECSLFIVEIDNLDTITDTIGREAGTLLYKKVSNTIMSELSENDLLGSYGKDGFIVLLDETDLKHAKEVAEKSRLKVSQIKLKYKDHVITSTISVGLTIVSEPDEDLSSLMRKADMGLFVAKENGCNTIKVSL